MSLKSILYVTLGLLVWPGQSVPTSSSSARGTTEQHQGQDQSQSLGRQAAAVHDIVFRGTEVPPETIKAQGGFVPNDRGQPQTDYTFGLKSHAEGGNSTMYTSTTTDFKVANYFAYWFSGSGPTRYIYQIKTTPNMIDLTQSGYSEAEYSALGGILFDQVMQWVELGPIDPSDEAYFKKPQVFDTYDAFKLARNKTWVKNSAYNAAKYEKLSVSPFQPQLEEPRSADDQSGYKTLEQYAIEFMNKVGAVVGWDGKFPLKGVRSESKGQGHV